MGSRASRPHGLGSRAHGPRVGRADEAPRLCAIRRAGRRLGRIHRRPCGVAGAEGRSPSTRTSCASAPATSTSASQPATHRRPISPTCERRALRGAGASFKHVDYARLMAYAAADALRHCRLSGRSRGLADRPRRWRWPACGHRRGGPGRASSNEEAHARRRPRQHHPLLADQHGRLRPAALLGIQGSAFSTPRASRSQSRSASSPASSIRPPGVGRSGPTRT